MYDFITNLPLMLGGAGTGSPGGAGQSVSLLVSMGLLIVIFYFLILRPQRKRQKESKKMLEALKKGDRIATIGGIRGVVHAVTDDTVVIRVDDSAKIEFTKSAIASVLEQSSGDNK